MELSKNLFHPMNEFVIENVELIDGTGGPSRRSSVYVKDGKILRISQDSAELPRCQNHIDAEGKYLVPGFIDAHGHSDISIIAAPEAEGKISQGITTEIAGNCGLSVFPISQKNISHIRDLYKRYGISISWGNLNEYADFINHVNPSINIASHIGHNTLRGAVLGYEKKNISDSDLSEMKKLLYDSLKMGAVGFSTGFLYVPGIFAGDDEVLSLLQTNAKFAKIYATHLRSEGDFLLESIRESIMHCKVSGCRMFHISHLKTAGRSNWNKLEQVLNIIEGEKELTITADRYPYVESMTNLSVYLPGFIREMEDVQISKLLCNHEFKQKVEETIAVLDDKFWEAMRLINSSILDYSVFCGESFIQIAKKKGCSPQKICIDLLSDAPSALVAMSGMSFENMKKILTLPYVCCGTDESAKNCNYKLGRSHPRGFASFPEFINITSKKIPFEEVIRKITSLPSKIFGLRGRGLIKEGFMADLVLLNPERLKANANFANPHLISEGVEMVWVNGVLSWCEGRHTGKRGGIFIKV